MRDRNLRRPESRGGVFCRIVHAISTSGCDAAVVESGNLRCKKFDAEILDAVPVDAVTEDLTPTDVTVQVWNSIPEAMTAGQYLLIGQRSDGRWTILVWPCD